MNAEFSLEIIRDDRALRRLAESLTGKPVTAVAVDLETTDWWDRGRERISLIQIAYREKFKIKAAVIDAFTVHELTPLKILLEGETVIKVIHNAAFDAPRLNKFYRIGVAPVHDTMRIARASGERRYSLKAQAEIHLNLHLDKATRATDWSRRPLDTRQIYYAAADAYAALLLYENQLARGLRGDYRANRPPAGTTQFRLPLEDAAVEPLSVIEHTVPESPVSHGDQLSEIPIALLGIVAELPTRYGPESLIASAGQDRVGLAGWIIDRRLGKSADLDEEAVRLAITDLCDQRLIELSDTRRFKATAKGSELWQKHKDE